VVTDLVLLRVDYCNAILAGLPALMLVPLQRVRYTTAGTILNFKPHDQVTPALQELHWLPVAERIKYRLCLLVHKAFIGDAPDYLTNLLKPASDVSSCSSLRSSSRSNTVVPRTRRKIGDKAFFAGDPMLLKDILKVLSLCEHIKLCCEITV